MNILTLFGTIANLIIQNPHSLHQPGKKWKLTLNMFSFFYYYYYYYITTKIVSGTNNKPKPLENLTLTSETQSCILGHKLGSPGQYNQTYINISPRHYSHNKMVYNGTNLKLRIKKKGYKKSVISWINKTHLSTSMPFRPFATISYKKCFSRVPYQWRLL